MQRLLIRNRKVILAFILGIVISSIGVYATTILSSSEVFYDNSKSNSSSNNVQGAIEELYQKSDNCTTGSDSITKLNSYVVGYTYNQEKDSPNYCVTGDESTCVQTDCYTSSEKTCPAGTIIDYIVSGTIIDYVVNGANNRVRFHVIKDKGKTMTMQSQRNTIYNIPWISKEDYVNAGGTESEYGSNGNNNKGPLTVLPALEAATASWTNVNNQTYTMGTTVFQENAYTGCTQDNCTTNQYILPERTTKARMITAQELLTLGCTSAFKSCPIWIYNYLYDSTSYGGTVNDTHTENKSSSNFGYWAISASSSINSKALDIYFYGMLDLVGLISTNHGARAVVEVSK